MSIEVYFEDVQVGDAIPEFTAGPVTEVQIVRYAGASGDFNPIHTVHSVAEKANLGGVIAHGMLIMGFAARAITRWVPDRALRRFSVRFRGITRPGDVITVTGRVAEKRTDGGLHVVACELTARNQQGDTKLIGRFEAALPSRTESNERIGRS